ncbi:putative transposase [Trichonephila clavipes]|nr:putative transposase [Trichonephila clavipes]
MSAGFFNSTTALQILAFIWPILANHPPYACCFRDFPRLNEFTCRNCGGGDRGRVAIYRPFGEVSLSLNRTVTCMVLKANDRRTSCPCHDEFRGPRSDYVRQIKCLSLADVDGNKWYSSDFKQPFNQKSTEVRLVEHDGHMTCHFDPSLCPPQSEANPKVYVETPLHPEKLTVWCALWPGGIIGPYFFKNDEGHNVTVNGDRYRAMITNFFIPELNNHDVQELWFQQDGATCHTAGATIDLLKDTFGDRLISRFGPVIWPPRSCDLTPLDYFLWGYVKSLVYADKPQTLDHLEDNIRRVIADIRPQMLEKVIENWTSRLDYIRASRGSHMPEIIFKM